MRHPPNEPDRSTEFTTFMRAYQDMVYSTAYRLSGSDKQAEDLAQEAFLRAYEHFEELRDSPAAGGWLKTVTTNLALNHLTRYRKRWRLFSDLPPQSDLDTAQPDTVLAELGAQERRRAIDDAIARLPEQQRLALVLYHFEGLSYEEIAQKLRFSLAKVKTDIRRARAALLPLLPKDDL